MENQLNKYSKCLLSLEVHSPNEELNLNPAGNVNSQSPSSVMVNIGSSLTFFLFPVLLKQQICFTGGNP